MVETVHDLRSASNDFNDMTFTAQLGSSFFFPLGNLLLCDRKHESDQNPGQTQPKLTQAISLWRVLGKTSSVNAPGQLINPEAYMLLSKCYMYLMA